MYSYTIKSDILRLQEVILSDLLLHFAHLTLFVLVIKGKQRKGKANFLKIMKKKEILLLIN